MSEVAMPTSVKIQAPPPGLEREPLVANQRGPGWISDRVAGIIEGKTPKWWWYAFILFAVPFLVSHALHS